MDVRKRSNERRWGSGPGQHVITLMGFLMNMKGKVFDLGMRGICASFFGDKAQSQSMKVNVDVGSRGLE